MDTKNRFVMSLTLSIRTKAGEIFKAFSSSFSRWIRITSFLRLFAISLKILLFFDIASKLVANTLKLLYTDPQQNEKKKSEFHNWGETCLQSSLSTPQKYLLGLCRMPWLRNAQAWENDIPDDCAVTKWGILILQSIFCHEISPLNKIACKGKVVRHAPSHSSSYWKFSIK